MEIGGKVLTTVVWTVTVRPEIGATAYTLRVIL
jgi:hypothetical protein